MDAQRKKGILDVCVLAVLKKGPSYGYMIIRDISRCIEISESTLYPILKRLEQNGSLKTYRQEYNGRTRKYYELTETGQARIDVFLEEWDELQTMYRFVEEENAQEPQNQDEIVEMNEEEVKEKAEAAEAESEMNLSASEDETESPMGISVPENVKQEEKAETVVLENGLQDNKTETEVLTEALGQTPDIADTRED